MTGPLEPTSSDAFRERRLELFNDLADSLREIVKRWNDRLTPERLSIPEAYRKGRVSLVLYLKCSCGVRPGDFDTTGSGDFKNDIAPDAVAIIEAHSVDSRHRHDRNQQLVLSRMSSL